MLDIKQGVKDNFNKSAATYSKYSLMQKEMATDLMVFLNKTGRGFKNILEIGCGTGFLTSLLADAFPQARITALDISTEMVEAARRNLKDEERIEFLVADGENMVTDKTFDLIISNAVFQWFTDTTGAFTRYYEIIESGGYLVFNTLGERTLEELRFCLAQLEDGYRVSRIPLRLPDRSTLLGELYQAGFIDIEIEDYIKKEYHVSARQLVVSLKKVGAQSFLDQDYLQGGIGTRIFKLIKIYNQCFSCNQLVPASYHCMMGCGRKQNDDYKP